LVESVSQWRELCRRRQLIHVHVPCGLFGRIL
jgi:hypothetical protein